MQACAPTLLHLLCPQAEDEDVLCANVVANFDIRSIQRADCERTVQGKLHVAGAGSFHSRRRNLLGQVGGGNDLLRQTDIVIGQENDPQEIANEGIAIDDLGHIIDELDDQLCLRVVRRRFPGEYLHPRYPIPIRLCPDRVIERDRFK